MLAEDSMARRWARRLSPWLLIAAVIVVWLWPITLAGRMPIGGDVTSFFLPLMAYYRRALLDGRIPLWNELWGYGFPCLAESQSGVLYPPHLILFRLFETETAYSINIVLHSVLAGWFAYVCGREFGLRRWGATLTGLVFAGNGFFIIHFPHQWSYTTGCWMPLAVALAWRAVRGQGSGVRGQGSGSEPQTTQRPIAGRVRAGLGLALVLAVQMLAGHFQLAFYTQIVVLLLGLFASLQALRAKIRVNVRNRPAASVPSQAALLWVAPPVAAAFVMAAVQLLPTRELIWIALPEGRDFEYLSGFANTPLHLVSYLLPTLFHVNPLWRPVAWDPFHTSPEECFSYIGLLPLCLAAGAAWRWRREPRVRLWVFLVVVTLLLSLGPYQPFFRGLIRWPGFDGFRAASRWSVVTALFLALLAGRAIDGALATRRLRRWLCTLVMAFVVFGGATIGSMWVLIDAGNPRTARAWTSAAVGWVDRQWRALSPWEDREGLLEAALAAHDPLSGWREARKLADLGYQIDAWAGKPLEPLWERLIAQFTLSNSFRRILLEEMLPPTALLCVLLVCLRGLVRGRRVPRGLVIGLAVADIGAAAWLRPTDFATRGRLVEQSAVLRFLAEHAQSQRVHDWHQNLPMLAGTAPTESYRTVDIPMNSLWDRPDSSRHPVEWKHRVEDRFNVAWVFETWFTRVWARREGDEDFTITDPVLGRLDYGRGLVQAFPEATTRFTIHRRADGARSHAWFWDAEQDAERFRSLVQPGAADSRPPAALTYDWLLRPPLTPVKQLRAEPEFEEYEVNASGPGAVVVSALAYPGWEATLIAPDGVLRSATDGSRSGCRVVQVPAAGKYRLELEFRSRSFERGRLISLVAGAIWMALMLATFWSRRVLAKT